MKKESLLILIPKLIMAVILIIGIVAVFGILGYFKTIPKNGYKTTEIAEKPIIKKEIKCPENWKEYKHDIVGIKFCYPEEWGRLTTSPKSEITRIEDVVSEFDSEHNRNYNSFFIEFENNKNISLRFFNEQYGGEYYPNSYAYAHGYVDNIPLLKSTGDICKYKI
ncbi:MAG: hypothetical protein U9N04_03450, partial [Patescibacteria group bacterium]|nr:hypothetical protein [Patescibacteria group bacterium]